MNGKRFTTFLIIIAVLLALSKLNPFYVYSENVVLYSTVITNWDGWIITLNISTPRVCEAGSVAPIVMQFYVVERGGGVRLSITNATVFTSNIRVSKYVGVFHDVGNWKEISIGFPLVKHDYAVIGRGVSLKENLTISLSGYIEYSDGTRRDLEYSYTLPLIVIAPQSPLKLSLNVDRYGNKYELSTLIQNFGFTPLYNIYVNIYINDSSIYKVYSLASMGYNDERTFKDIISLTAPGIYNIVAVANYTTANGAIGYAIAATRIAVKETPYISIYTENTRATVSTPITINCIAKPSKQYSISIEYSLNGIEWNYIDIIETNSSGVAKYLWKPSITGTIYLRARIYEAELYKEATSNVLTIYIDKVTPKIVVSAEKLLVNVGEQTKLSVSVDPPMQLNMRILYMAPTDTQWRVYTDIRADAEGKASIPSQFFIQQGVYTYKVVAEETEVTAYSESNQLSIKVVASQTTTAIQTTSSIAEGPLQPRERFRDVVILGVILSSAIATLMLFIGRRR